MERLWISSFSSITGRCENPSDCYDSLCLPSMHTYYFSLQEQYLESKNFPEETHISSLTATPPATNTHIQRTGHVHTELFLGHMSSSLNTYEEKSCSHTTKVYTTEDFKLLTIKEKCHI